MEAIKECIYISLLVLISTMMPRVTECFQSLQATNSCISLNKRYLPALTNNLSPEYIKTSEELKNQIRDAGYSTHDIDFYEGYNGRVLANVVIKGNWIKLDELEDYLKKVGPIVWLVNSPCDCEVCRKWSEYYPCGQLDHPGGQPRCRLNLCVQFDCYLQIETNCTGNSITKKADDCPTRPMTNITNRDPNGEDNSSITHKDFNKTDFNKTSSTTPMTDTSNTGQNCTVSMVVTGIVVLLITAAVSMFAPIPKINLWQSLKDKYEGGESLKTGKAKKQCGSLEENGGDNYTPLPTQVNDSNLE